MRDAEDHLERTHYLLLILLPLPRGRCRRRRALSRAVKFLEFSSCALEGRDAREANETVIRPSRPTTTRRRSARSPKKKEKEPRMMWQ